MAAFTAVLIDCIRRLSLIPAVRRAPYGLPLPATLHQVLPKNKLEGKTLLIIGDVHGCCDELEELLEKCKQKTPSELLVVFVGDLVNKGPKNAEVVKLARRIGAYSVRGNHDDVSLREWRQHHVNGHPLAQKFRWLGELSESDINWLSSLPFSISIPSRQILIVHAGMVPGVALEQQDLHDLTHMRHVRLTEEGRYAGLDNKAAGSTPWAPAWPGPQHVYFGHDARGGFQKCPHATGLDTGCVYGQKLTAVFPDSGEKVEVDSKTNCKA